MEPFPILLVAGTAVLVGVILFVTTRRRRARDEAVRAWTARHGWTRGEADPGDLFRTHLFSTRRRGGKCRNVHALRSDGLQQLLFEYSFLENTGNSTHRVRQTVLAMRRDEPGAEERWPAFELRPEKFGDRVASVFGKGDIDFDHRPEFSRKMLLRGEDEPAIRRLFDATRMRFFEQNAAWSVESDGEWLVVYRARHECKPDEMDAFVTDARRIRDLLRPRSG